MGWTRAEYNAVIEKECGRRPKYLRSFWKYHDNNPHVFKRYLRAAKRLEAEGREHISIGDITENLRHHTRMKTVDVDGEGLKLKHNNRAYYARLVILARPSLGQILTLGTMGTKADREKQGPVPYKHNVKKGQVRAYLWMTGKWPGEDGAA
jgi:hypothetical protein